MSLMSISLLFMVSSHFPPHSVSHFVCLMYDATFPCLWFLEYGILMVFTSIIFPPPKQIERQLSQFLTSTCCLGVSQWQLRWWLKACLSCSLAKTKQNPKKIYKYNWQGNLCTWAHKHYGRGKGTEKGQILALLLGYWVLVVTSWNGSIYRGGVKSCWCFSRANGESLKFPISLSYSLIEWINQ